MPRWLEVTWLPVAMCLLPAALPLNAREPGRDHPRHERTVDAASALYALCRRELEAHYVGLGEQVYQWTGSYHDYANTLHAKGKLRVQGRDVEVACRISRGARERHMAMDIDDPGA